MYAASGGYDPGMSANPMGMNAGPFSPPLHMPHHVFQPFTPGTTMSPGAFWGHPGASGGHHAPYLNPAVGSPVLMHPPYAIGHGGSQPGSPAFVYSTGEEPSGYFPPVRSEGYFPPVSMLGGSGLANEILREGSTMVAEDANEAVRERYARSDSGTDSEGGREHEAGNEAETEGRAQSSSSGATSWPSSDENIHAVGARVGAAPDAKGGISTLANDMASLQLGASPAPRGKCRRESYARAV
ncbi:hypothetical protein EW145_g8669, partial [Phellinidium pouzarii]